MRGGLPWDTFLYACPKKSGKTTINAALTIWWGFTQEPPNELFILANDEEQALSRVFSTAARIIQRNAALVESVTVQAGRLLFSSGTEARGLASDYRGNAGANQGWTSWEEIWAYTSEAARRLWEEFTVVPTRRNSLRFISTYAGWEGESDLLHELYVQGVGPEEHPDGQGARIHPTLPLYLNRAARLLVYWDHEGRMPWQTPAYLEAQRRALRPASYLRLHENRWASAESTFILPELWDANVDPEHHPLLPTKAAALYVAADAGIKNDMAAVVGVCRVQDRLVLAVHRMWRPTKEHPIDLEATIESFLRELHVRFHLARIVCDPYQLHRSITTLKAAGLPIEEFPQTVTNTVRMGQGLFELLKGKNLRLYPDVELRQQALNTVGIEGSRGVRIAKERASKKIDGIVALSMACVAAIDAATHRTVPAASIAAWGEGMDNLTRASHWLNTEQGGITQ